MAKGITTTPATYTVRLSVGGKQYFLGTFDSEAKATAVYDKAVKAKNTLEAHTRKAFEEHMGINTTQVVAPKPSRRAAPAPIYKPEGRVRTQPAPQVVESEPEYLNDRAVRERTPLATLEGKIASVGAKRYDIDEYESHMNLEYDTCHVYWKDTNTDKFVFKTVND